MAGIPWRAIHDYLLEVGEATTESDFYARVLSRLDAVIPHDKGCAIFLYDHAGPAWVAGSHEVSWGSDFNRHYRHVPPAPWSVIDGAPVLCDFRPFERSEYVGGFVRPRGIWQGLCVNQGRLRPTILRSRRSTEFADHEVSTLQILHPHINNFHRILTRMALLTRASLSQGELAFDCRLLTRREAEIVRYLALRMSPREIGLSLLISTRTVERHIANVYEKLGVHDRRGLFARIYGKEALSKPSEGA